MLQTAAVDLVVLAAALWLAWTFSPASLRAAITRRRARPSYDLALQADELAGAPPEDGACACGEQKGGCH